MKEISNLIITLLMTLISLVVGGFVVKYGWNTFVTSAFSISRISLPVAIGIDVLVTYITGYSGSDKVRKHASRYEALGEASILFIYGVTQSLWTLLIMYVVAQFV